MANNYDELKFDKSSYKLDETQLTKICDNRYSSLQSKFGDVNIAQFKYLTGSISNKCNLNCINCSAHIPYVKTPKFFTVNNFDDQLRIFLKIAKIGTLNIEGAEPFLHPQWHEYAKIAISYLHNGINGISFFTNGTIVPNAEQLDVIANNPNVHICISDYGKVSRNLHRLCNILTCAKIHHYVIPYNEHKWNRVSYPNKKELSTTQAHALYKNCRGRLYCPTIRDGEFSPCGGVTKIYDVINQPEIKEDVFYYYKLYSEGISIDQIKKLFYKYMHEKKY